MNLHIKAKLLTLHDVMHVYNEDEEVVYQSGSKLLSLHHKTVLEDAFERKVADISTKLISLHNTHFVEMADGTSFSISEELFHATTDILNIEELGWQIRGNILEHDYEIVDAEEQILAKGHRKWMTLHKTYNIDIIDESKADILVAIFIVLEQLVDQKNMGRNAQIGDGADA